MLPSTAFATGDIAIGASDVDNLVVCENHKEHTEGEDGCGYVAAVEGTPCAYLNEGGSFSSATAVSADEATQRDAEYVCPHDDCGFIAAIEGSPCKHECELCKVQDSGTPPINAPSEAQKRGEPPCKDETERLLYLGELAPESTELTAKQQAFLDAHLAICEVCDTIMNPPLMNLSTVIDVADITALNNALSSNADTEIRLTATKDGGYTASCVVTVSTYSSGGSTGGGNSGGGGSSNTTKPTEPVSGSTENKATVDDKGNL